MEGPAATQVRSSGGGGEFFLDQPVGVNPCCRALGKDLGDLNVLASPQDLRHNVLPLRSDLGFLQPYAVRIANEVDTHAVAEVEEHGVGEAFVSPHCLRQRVSELTHAKTEMEHGE